MWRGVCLVEDGVADRRLQSIGGGMRARIEHAAASGCLDRGSGIRLASPIS